MAAMTESVTILDPRAGKAIDLGGDGPDLGPLRGKVIGLKTDEFWFSWDWVAEEWAAMLEADGAMCTVWREPMPQGKSTPFDEEGYNHFLDSVDCVIVGLATCGSCTFVTVRAGVTALDKGFPTVFVSTEYFERLARVLAEEKGRSQIRLLPLPYPLEGRAESEVRQIARDRYAGLLAQIGAVR
jgi:hypothetical protein